MKADLKLRMLLDALRTFNNYILSDVDTKAETIAALLADERMITDKVMFNMGWHAAREVEIAELKGSASTEKVWPELVRIAESSSGLADLIKRCDDAKARLKKLNPAGRQKGSYKSWHFEPGYQVVVAMIELYPEKKIEDHIRWGVKEGWLEEEIKNTTHRSRITDIQERQAREELARLQALGKNIVSLRQKRKTRKITRH